MKDGIPSLPSSGLIRKIFDYVKERSKAPDIIVFWSIVSLLGACLKDKIMIDWAGKPIFPNFPLLIVAPSGWGKTGSIRSSENIFDGHLPNKISEDSTAESAIKQFALSPFHSKFATCALWIVPELSDVFGKKKYQEGLISRITRLLDSPKNHKITRGKGETYTINGYAVLNWIACTTYEWLTESVEASMSTGGFLPRLFTVYTTNPPKNVPNPMRDHKIESELSLALKQAISAKIESRITLSPEVISVLEKNHEEFILATGQDSQPFMARRDENFLRIYLIFKMFSGIPELTDLLSSCYGCCKWFEDNSLTLYSSIKKNKKENNKYYDYDIYNKVCKKFRKNPNSKITYAKICRDLDCQSHSLKPILNDMLDAGYINWDRTLGETGIIYVTASILEAKFNP